jgi:hypothetical protein
VHAPPRPRAWSRIVPLVRIVLAVGANENDLQ